jgi:hypothetical protein
MSTVKAKMVEKKYRKEQKQYLDMTCQLRLTKLVGELFDESDCAGNTLPMLRTMVGIQSYCLKERQIFPD